MGLSFLDLALLGVVVSVFDRAFIASDIVMSLCQRPSHMPGLVLTFSLCLFQLGLNDESHLNVSLAYTDIGWPCCGKPDYT
jgi:hypothetical protein